MMTYERLAQILLANGVNSPAELEKVLRYVLVLRDRPLPLDCPTVGGGSNQEGAGDPAGALAPDFVGQRYKDTNTGNIWIANSTTPGDWTLEVQNTQLIWTPHSLNLTPQIALSASPVSGDPTLVGITGLVLNVDSLLYIELFECNTLTSITSPVLASITAANQSYQSLVTTSSSLKTISFPALTSVFGPIDLTAISSLTTVDFSALQSVNVTNPDVAITVRNSPLLTTIDISSYVPVNNSTGNFSFNALTNDAITNILARFVANVGYVSGEILLNGGTNAVPAGLAAAHKATLIGRGVTVTTN